MKSAAGRRRMMMGIAVAAATTVMVSACGSSSGGSSGGGVKATAPGTPATGTPIRITTINDNTGVQPLPDVIATGNALVAQINANGGINGHPLQIKFCSGEVNPNTTQQCARDAVNDSSVVANVGSFMAADSGASQAMADAGLAQVGIFPVSQSSYSCKTCYPLVGGAVQSEFSTATVLADVAHASRIGIAIVDIPEGRRLPGLVNAFLTARGSKARLVKEIYIPNTTTDFSSYVATALHSDLDGVLIGLPRLMALSFIRAVGQQNGKILMSHPLSGMTADDVRKLGPAGNNVYITSMYSQTSPQHETFIELQKSVADDIPMGSDNSANIYASIKAFVDLAKSINGAITRESVAKAAQTFTWNGGPGLAPPVNFAGYDNKLLGGAFPRLVTGANYYNRVKNGKIEPLCGGKSLDVMKESTCS